MSKVYRGERTIAGIVVTCDMHVLNPGLDIAHLSDVGLDWGFDGPASRQLALALLVDHLGDDARAITLTPAFSLGMTSQLGNEWELASEDIDDAVHIIEGG